MPIPPNGRRSSWSGRGLHADNPALRKIGTLRSPPAARHVREYALTLRGRAMALGSPARSRRAPQFCIESRVKSTAPELRVRRSIDRGSSTGRRFWVTYGPHDHIRRTSVDPPLSDRIGAAPNTSVRCRFCCKSILEPVRARECRKRFLPTAARGPGFPTDAVMQDEILSVIPSIRHRSAFCTKSASKGVDPRQRCRRIGQSDPQQD